MQHTNVLAQNVRERSRGVSDVLSGVSCKQRKEWSASFARRRSRNARKKRGSGDGRLPRPVQKKLLMHGLSAVRPKSAGGGTRGAISQWRKSSMVDHRLDDGRC